MVSIVGFATILSGCEDIQSINLSAGLTDQVYEPSPVYAGRPTSVGTLTQAYIQNTEGLLNANARLELLCKAHRRCEQ